VALDVLGLKGPGIDDHGLLLAVHHLLHKGRVHDLAVLFEVGLLGGRRGQGDGQDRYHGQGREADTHEFSHYL
jgi:hypothetical protein